VIGNDIVDLVNDEARAERLHERFDRRVFTESERAVLEDHASDHALRWALWAAKESAFKVVRRRVPATAFAPIRFAVSLRRDFCGLVYHEGRRYPVRVHVDADHVHAVATEPGRTFDGVFAGVQRVSGVTTASAPGDDASLEARAFAIREIAARIGVSADTLAIDRRDRVPRLVDLTGVEPLDLSLSHHGRFVAYACASQRPPVHVAW